jgi:hypothetical protein
VVAAGKLRGFPEDFIEAGTSWRRIVRGVKEAILADDFAEDAQDSGAVATGENFVDTFVVEDERADSVALLEDAPGGEGGGFGGDYRLHGDAAAEKHVHALIHDEEGGAVALFGVHADEGPAHPGGDVPIDYANVVTEDVVAKLFEIQAATAHARAATACEQTVDGLARQEGKAAGFEFQREQ